MGTPAAGQSGAPATPTPAEVGSARHPGPLSGLIRPLLISLALGTWCFLNTWAQLATGNGRFFARFDPRATVALPVLCWEVIIAAAVLSGYVVCRRLRVHQRVQDFVFLAISAVPLAFGVYVVLRIAPVSLIPSMYSSKFRIAALAAVFLAGALAVRRPHTIARCTASIFLYSWPVLLFLMALSAVKGLASPPSDYLDGPSAAMLNDTPRIRVVWIVFDELSRKIAFEVRPAGLRLPNFDRLRSESFFAASAIPPGTATLFCMPSLITGKEVVKSDPNGPRTLHLVTTTGERFAFNSTDNVFSDVRRMGHNTALAGWFHPYCRILNSSLSQCYFMASWLTDGIVEPARPKSLGKNMWLHAKVQLNTALPLAGHVPGVHRDLYLHREVAERMELLLEHGDRFAANPAMGLTLIHIPVPHPPHVYNRALNRIDADSTNSYVDSLALADKVLGRFRADLEHAGLWDRTALLVSSDHGWRWGMWINSREWTAEDSSVRRDDDIGVPFIVKLPGQSAALTYSKPFNTVLSRSLITNILRGDIRAPADVARLIDNTPDVPVPPRMLPTVQ